jgi:tRNA G18 (ribose-2'-O)-methylase SpoU
MDIQEIHSIDDPRVAPYRALKDRDIARTSDRFIAEGEFLVKRLLASAFPVESVLLARKEAEKVIPFLRPEVPTYIAPNSLLDDLIGFKFHRGALACGRRGPSPSIEDLLRPGSSGETLLICPDLNNTANLGAIVRVAAGLGAAGIILGERSCDPFWRQAVRVSMGAVFHLPIVRSQDVRRDLEVLRSIHAVELVATVVDPEAEAIEATARPRAPDRVGILLGNEAEGLDSSHLALCGRKVTIPMDRETDSINVVAAAAIVLHHFARVARRPQAD